MFLMDVLQYIARDAAAGDAITEYLELLGVKTAATLALLSKDEGALDPPLAQPLLQGWKRPDGTNLTIPDSDKPTAKGVIFHMLWMLAKQNYWAVSQAAMRPITPTTSTSPAAMEDKIPKNLAPDRWAKLLQELQSQQIGNEDRIFPVREVLGVESILAQT